MRNNVQKNWSENPDIINKKKEEREPQYKRHASDIERFREIKQELTCVHLIKQSVGLWGSHL